MAPRFTQRETVELMERMDIQCTPILLRSTTELYLDGWDWGLENEPRAKKDAVLKEINAALDKDYDLIIMGSVATQQMPKDMVTKIEDKIRKGCGLVFDRKASDGTGFGGGSLEGEDCRRSRFHHQRRSLRKARGIQGPRRRAIGEKDIERLVSAHQYGNGRVVFIEYAEWKPSPLPDSA